MTITEQTTLSELQLEASRYGVDSIVLKTITVLGLVQTKAVLETKHHPPIGGRGKTPAEAIAAAFEHLRHAIARELAKQARP